MSKMGNEVIRDAESRSLDNAAEVERLRAELARLEKDNLGLREACRIAYGHLDTYGTASGGHEREMRSQQITFAALRPFVYP